MENKDLLDGLSVMILAGIVIFAVTVSAAVGAFFGIGYGLVALASFTLAAVIAMLAVFKGVSK